MSLKVVEDLGRLETPSGRKKRYYLCEWWLTRSENSKKMHEDKRRKVL